jgi:hypothetical protein
MQKVEIFGEEEVVIGTQMLVSGWGYADAMLPATELGRHVEGSSLTRQHGGAANDRTGHLVVVDVSPRLEVWVVIHAGSLTLPVDRAGPR